jgi:hypothetical protein
VHKFNHLVTFAKKKTCKIVHDIVTTKYVDDLFHLPLPQEAYIEFNEMEDLCAKTIQKVQK